ncbi:hypothetical protein BgAZ_303160 [Babesia gibsoni]|uniref:Uncharacterized protein n=1 Tax=Babesia gibsoni TaxID=33632 RepID=A0AAD8LJX3_BABGI|nr:hypothetical protein BgAZ_303160 [Babesia gibsoni]
MAKVEPLYRPPRRSLLEVRSNLATDLRQKAIAKTRGRKNKGLASSHSTGNLGNSVRLPSLRASDLLSQPPSENIHSSINDAVYRAKSALASVNIPGMDIEDIRRRYIQKVGHDYSAVGLTSYIIAQKDAKEFRERCFFILSWRPKTSVRHEQYDTSDSPFFSNRKPGRRRPKTPDEFLLGSFGEGDPLVNLEAASAVNYSPEESYRDYGNREYGNREYGNNMGSPFATQANMSDQGASLFSDRRGEDVPLRFRTLHSGDSRHRDISLSNSHAAKATPRSERSVETRTPEKGTLDSFRTKTRVVEDILEENKDLIPQDLDIKALGYAEKLKLLKRLGFEDDYIANRLCAKYASSRGHKNKKLTPLEAFSMYDRQDLKESIQVYKDLSGEFSRYKRGAGSPTVLLDESRTAKDIYSNIKAILES